MACITPPIAYPTFLLGALVQPFENKLANDETVLRLTAGLTASGGGNTGALEKVLRRLLTP